MNAIQKLFPVCLLMIVGSTTNDLQAATPSTAGSTLDLREAKVREALAAIDTWLTANPARQHWESYLRLRDLREAVDAKRGSTKSDGREILTAAIRRLSVPAAEVQSAPLARLKTALIALVNGNYRLAVDQLPAEVRSLPSTFRLYSRAEIDQAHKSLQNDLRDLEHDLAAQGKNGAAWKTYLEWDQWYPGLSKSEPVAAPLLIAVYKKFHSGYPGLESAPFARPRLSFDIYLRRELAADTTESQGSIDVHCEQLAVQLELLAVQLELLAGDMPHDWNIKAAEALAWLDLCGQRPDVTADLRERMSRPNVVMQVSAEFLAAAFADDIKDQSPVHDVILGAQISGTAKTEGIVQTRLVPDPQRGLLELSVRGAIASRTTAVKGIVQVHSHGTTPFNGKGLVTFDATGAHLDTFSFRAQTQCTPDSITNSARPLFAGLVERVASKKMAQDASQADWIASRHAESSLTKEFNAVANKKLGMLNQQWWEKVRQPLLMAGEFPDEVRFSTTARHIQATARQANLFQLASPENPPAIEGNPTLALSIHQSSVNNLFAGIRPGRTVTEEELRATLTRVLSRIAKPFGGDVPKETWSGTLSEHQPIHVTFEDHGFRLTLRGQSFSAGKAQYGAMDMAADYKLHRDGQNLVAERQGDVRFHGPEMPAVIVKVAQQLKVAQESNAGATEPASLLHYPMERLFPQQVVLESPLPLPDKCKEAGPLELTNVHCDDGWLRLEWNKASGPKVVSRK